jgi:hypothetical protein
MLVPPSTCLHPALKGGRCGDWVWYLCLRHK